ncbi:hypothetical protein BTJ68_13187 [Hortaea werneckii EXF-2000]|uniref:Ubiquitin-like domain-containing protein n=1 Tax=Hortaea werneckii EXF-2000 TaxID=1157616 RepID=A0A1Z5SSH2_HORWE|nr:hypothetical protein BTJ68_13187 [Hortaea werneckii EXF-2000]
MVLLKLNMSTSRTSSSESDGSVAPYRTPQTSPTFHGYDMTAADRYESETEDVHNATLPHSRTVIIVVKDAHDVDGSGMLFTLGLYASFENVFDTFKAHTCTTCRDPEKIRFKADGKKLSDEDTPKKIFPSLLHNQSLSIKAFSNSPAGGGLKCPACKKSGYPSSHGHILDGQVPCGGGEIGKKSLRLHFQDPDGRVTALSMGMKNRSVIVVHTFCIAG